MQIDFNVVTQEAIASSSEASFFIFHFSAFEGNKNRILKCFKIFKVPKFKVQS